MIREEYITIKPFVYTSMRWWSIVEKPGGQLSWKKRQGGIEEKANGSTRTLGNTLAISRNTGKSFHRFLRSVRVTRNPVSTRLGFHRIERVLSTLTARKNTRGWNLSAQNSHRNGISLCPPHSYPLGTRFDLSCMRVKFWGGGRFPFEKFPRKERKKSALSRILEFFVNWIVSRSTRSTRVT